MTNLHGVMLQIYGYGVLLLGESGVGKSLTAYTLLEKGHQLISDDSVLFRRLSDQKTLQAYAPAALFDRLEIRGLGIIKPSDTFGLIALRRTFPVHLVLELKSADHPEDFSLQRLIPEVRSWHYLGCSIPLLSLIVTAPMALPLAVEQAVCHWHIHTQQELSLCTS